MTLHARRRAVMVRNAEVHDAIDCGVLTADDDGIATNLDAAKPWQDHVDRRRKRHALEAGIRGVDELRYGCRALRCRDLRDARAEERPEPLADGAHPRSGDASGAEYLGRWICRRRHRALRVVQRDVRAGFAYGAQEQNVARGVPP